MHTTQHLLFEIGSEELPAKGLAALGQQLHQHLTALLLKHQLSFSAENSTYYASPRRLAVFIADCQTQQAPQTLNRKGPKLTQAFNAEGQATPAALGFAKSCGVALSELKTETHADGDYLCHQHTTAGQATLTLLAELIPLAISQLTIARPMRWGNHSHAFVRPVKWLLALFGQDLIDVNCFGIAADRYSYGHRFMAPAALCFQNADRTQYEETLSQAFVIAHFETRQQQILTQLQQQATQQNGHVVLDNALLTEVTGLVEWPQALTIPFAAKFLNLPAAALIASMQEHQKCFAIQDNASALLPAFITISNIRSVDAAAVIQGNARVMNARLSDAEFFYEQDLKTPLGAYQATLANMTFQRALGSMHDKVTALEQLTALIAPLLGADLFMARLSATLAKSDLCTHMVGEFPELQGFMGRTYALQQGIDASVATALYEQYLPRFAGDALPETALGASLALADRLLTLTGIFGIQQIPTGDKDPFALRRAALGVIRIILAQQQTVPLMTLLDASVAIWLKQQARFGASHDTAKQVYSFIEDRLRYFWLEQPEFSALAREPLARAIEAVLAKKHGDFGDYRARLGAVIAFLDLDEAAALASANKRVNNLLTKEKWDGSVSYAIDNQLFEHSAESELVHTLSLTQAAMTTLLAKRDYVTALRSLAALKSPIDAFFADVMVLAEDRAVRHNRCAILSEVQRLLGSVADISLL